MLQIIYYYHLKIHLFSCRTIRFIKGWFQSRESSATIENLQFLGAKHSEVSRELKYALDGENKLNIAQIAFEKFCENNSSEKHTCAEYVQWF